LQIKHITIINFQTTTYFLNCLGKMMVVQKSRFQVTKTLKMNIMKHSSNKYRTHDSLKIRIEHVYSITCLFKSA